MAPNLDGNTRSLLHVFGEGGGGGGGGGAIKVVHMKLR